MLRLLMIFLIAIFYSGSAFAVTLKSAVTKAVETHPRIEAAKANFRATEHVLQQAKGRFFPEVDLSGEVGKEIIDRPGAGGLSPDFNNEWRRPRQATLSVRQVLFDGWERANNVYRSQARITAASHRVLARSEAVGLNAVEAYVDIERHKILLNLASRHVRRHRTLLGIIQERIDGGRAPISDLEQTRERLEAAKALAAQIAVALETAKAKYKAAVGEPAKNLKSVPRAKGVPHSAEAVLEMAVQNNPQLSAVAAEYDIANFEREQFKSSFYPQVYLEGKRMKGLELNGNPGSDDETKVSLTMRWRLFDGGVRRSRDSELAERASEKLADREILLREITQEIDINWARRTTGRAEVEALRRQVDQNQKVVNSYNNEYEADKRSLLDVLDAENAKFGSEFQYNNARSLHLFAGYQLLANMGKLLDSMGIERPTDSLVYDDPVFGLKFTPTFGSGQFTIPPLK